MSAEPEQKGIRLLSIDVFRGFTIALMILVNSPGLTQVYSLLEHSAWNGCTLADLVFPFFLFIVGVSLTMSLRKANQLGYSKVQLLNKIFKRSLILFALGVLLNAFPHHFEWSTLRFYGVLQRIAVCYFFSAILFLTFSPEKQLTIVILLLVGYWFLLVQIEVPVFGFPFTKENNWAAYIDRLLFSSAHLYGKTYDPEGLLSTLPAIGTTLFGNLTGLWLCSPYKKLTKLEGLIITGVITLVLGGLWGMSFPINKVLWTSSYVLWTAGIALLTLACCYWLIEIKNWKKWSKPFEIFGANAILAYVLHIFFLRLQAVITINVNGSAQTLRSYLTHVAFGFLSPKNASLCYALCYTLFWLFILSILYQRKIFVKI